MIRTDLLFVDTVVFTLNELGVRHMYLSELRNFLSVPPPKIRKKSVGTTEL